MNGLAGHSDAIDDALESAARALPLVLIPLLLALWFWPVRHVARGARQWACLGTTQLADVVALGPFAAPEVITAWSLAQIALNGLIGGLVAIAALASLAGWSGTRRLLAHLRRGELAAGLRAVGARHHRRRK